MTEPSVKKPRSEHDKSKSYQYKHKKRQVLEIGQKGFLATCNFRERDCIRECYNILSHYADELYDPEPKGDTKQNPQKEETETDISDDLQKEIDATKASADPARCRRFQSVDTATKNCVFIKTTLPDPVELATHLIKDIAENKIQKTRYLLRLTPIEVVCKASVNDIANAGGTLFDKYFLKEGKTFSIVFNKRYNNDVKRDDIIKVLADLVQEKNVKNKVDLKNAELSVIVEIVKTKCCMSVVQGYTKYRKYNLVELASNRTEHTEETKTDGNEEAKRKTSNNEGLATEEKDVTDEEPTAKKFKEIDDAQKADNAPEPEKIET